MKQFKIKFLKLALMTAFIGQGALAGQTCAALNGYSSKPDLPNVICIQYADNATPSTVTIQLKRDNVLVSEILGASYMHPGGTVCNKHTGDCRSYPAHLAAQLSNADYAVQASYSTQYVSAIVSSAKYNSNQYTY